MKIKICGLTRLEHARAAERAGADFGGVILAPGSPRTVAPERAAEVFGETGLSRCGVFVNADERVVVDAAEVAGLAVLQLHGDESPRYLGRLRRSTGLTLWKAVNIRGAEDLERAIESFGDVVDGLMLDGWSAEARGGTGTRFSWEELSGARADIPADVDLIVAGGLDARNVAEAIGWLRPDIVDVSSGVESAPGIKDAEKVEQFVRAAKQAEIKEMAG